MSIRGGALVATLALLGASPLAYAQMSLPGPGPGTYGAAPPEQGEPQHTSVLQQPHPAYDPLGIRAGSFLILPSATLSETYDSNVFATPTGVKSDFYTDVAPTVSVNSDWNRHALDLSAGGDIKRYATQVSENYSNANAAANGRLDILRDIYLIGGLGYTLSHEDRASPNSTTGQKNPTEFQVGSGGIGYVHEPGRLGFRVDGTANWYSYSNAQTATGTTVVETDRNRVEYQVRPRVQYEIQPGYHAFVQASGNWREYQSAADQFGFHRNSSGYEVDAGTAVELTDIISGEVFAGYLSQSYADARLKPVSGVGFGGSLLWNVTQLTSVRMGVTRTVQETTVTGTGIGGTTQDASGDLQTAATASVEHELLRNVLVTGGVSYTEDAFQGVSRTDDSYGASAEARYLINRNLNAGLTFTYTKRDSSQSVNNYDREVVMARLRTQF